MSASLHACLKPLSSYCAMKVERILSPPHKKPSPWGEGGPLAVDEGCPLHQILSNVLLKPKSFTDLIPSDPAFGGFSISKGGRGVV